MPNPVFEEKEGLHHFCHPTGKNYLYRFFLDFPNDSVFVFTETIVTSTFGNKCKSVTLTLEGIPVWVPIPQIPLPIIQ